MVLIFTTARSKCAVCLLCCKYFVTKCGYLFSVRSPLKRLSWKTFMNNPIACNPTIASAWRKSLAGVEKANVLLRWRHNGHDGVSNHQSPHCLLNRLYECRSKKTSKFRVTGLCAGNSLGTGEFPAQMVSNAENASIWWRHHVDPIETPFWALFHRIQIWLEISLISIWFLAIWLSQIFAYAMTAWLSMHVQKLTNQILKKVWMRENVQNREVQSLPTHLVLSYWWAHLSWQ